MHYLTVVYEVDGATTAREILDSHPWTASSYSHAIHDRDAARYEIDSLQRYDQQTAPDFDVHTTAGGRGYVAWFFSNVLHRYDFADYINHALAADFACVLAKWLSTAPGRLVLDVPIISEGDMPVQAVRAAPVACLVAPARARKRKPERAVALQPHPDVTLPGHPATA